MKILVEHEKGCDKACGDYRRVCEGGCGVFLAPCAYKKESRCHMCFLKTHAEGCTCTFHKPS